MNPTEKYFGFIENNARRTECMEVFSSIYQDENKLKPTTDQILGSWLLSRLLRLLCKSSVDRGLGTNLMPLDGFVNEIVDVIRSSFGETPATVESIVNYCISILENNDSIMAFFNNFLDKAEHSDLEIGSTSKLRISVISALKSMKDEIKFSVQAHTEFINLWEISNDKASLHSFKEFLGDLSNEPKLLSKEFTWSLICAYDLSDSRHSVGRRKSLVSIAAAIAVVAGAFACHSGIRPNKRTQSGIIPNELSPKVPRLFKDKRRRREAMKESLFTLYSEGSNDNVTQRNNDSESCLFDQSTLLYFSFVSSTFMPELKASAGIIQEEMHNIASFLSEQIQFAQFDSSILGTIEGRKEVLFRIKEEYKKSIEDTSFWINEIKDIGTDTRLLFATPHRKSNPSIPFVSHTFKNYLYLELSNWLESIKMSSETVRPSGKLLSLLETSHKFTDGDCLDSVITPILNECLQRLLQHLNTGEEKKGTDISVQKQGVLRCQNSHRGDRKGKLSTPAFARAFIALYYHSLEIILDRERMRSNSPIFVMNKSFHQGVLCLTCMCLGHVMPVPTHQSAFFISDSNFYDFLKISEYFIASMVSSPNEYSSDLKLPKILVREIHAAEHAVLNQYMYCAPSKFFEIVNKLRQQGLWPPHILKGSGISKKGNSTDRRLSKESTNMRKDARFVECCMTKLIVTAGQTIRSLCSKLGIEYHSQHILLVLSDLLRVNVEMLRNRHVHTIIVCITYYASVTIAPHKSFKEIITDYKRIFGETQSNFVFDHVYLDSDRFGNIVSFYNEIFIVRAIASLESPIDKINNAGSHRPKVSVTIRKSGVQNRNIGPRKILTFGSSRNQSLKSRG